MYVKNPPKLKYSRFYDVTPMFDALSKWLGNENLMLWDLTLKVVLLTLLITPWCCGKIDKMQASPAGDREFDSRLTQTKDLKKLSLPSLTLDINRIGQGLVCSMSG